jgi:hypothetical protein
VIIVGKLADDKLKQAVEGAFRAKTHKQAAKLAIGISTAFSRIAVQLAAKDSERILTNARRQAQQVRSELIASKALMPSAQMTEALGVTRQALNKALQANRIFTVEQSGENYYPAFFSDPELDRRKLEQVAKSLGEVGGWSKWQFFTTPKGSLGGLTPLDALKKGRYAAVLSAADAFSER